MRLSARVRRTTRVFQNQKKKCSARKFDLTARRGWAPRRRGRRTDTLKCILGQIKCSLKPINITPTYETREDGQGTEFHIQRRPEGDLEHRDAEIYRGIRPQGREVFHSSRSGGVCKCGLSGERSRSLRSLREIGDTLVLYLLSSHFNL